MNKSMFFVSKNKKILGCIRYMLQREYLKIGALIIMYVHVFTLVLMFLKVLIAYWFWWNSCYKWIKRTIMKEFTTTISLCSSIVHSSKAKNEWGPSAKITKHKWNMQGLELSLSLMLEWCVKLILGFLSFYDSQN